MSVPSQWPYRIGILGGMGPFAHLGFERQLLEAAHRHLGHAPRDQDFPHWILVSLPYVPDRSAALLTGADSPVPVLLEGLRLLRTADFAVIACNTAHTFIDQLRGQSDLPILDIVAETIQAVTGGALENVKVGLIGSTGTLESGVYQERSKVICPQVEFVTPLDLKAGALTGEVIQKQYVTDLIYGRSEGVDDLEGGIKAGAYRKASVRRRMKASLTMLLRWFREAGVRTVVLGCTEIPLIVGPGRSNGILLVDPLEVAASCAIQIAAGIRSLPT